MSVEILLDPTLEKKSINNFTTLYPQDKLNLETPDNYFSQYEHSNKILKQGNNYRTQNNFINTFLDAYNYHKTLKLRPDDIKLQILTIISICVNNNPEKFRSYFVDFEGKKELIVKNPVFNPDYFCKKFAESLDENIKDKKFASHYTNKFTTTNQIISTVNNITLMNTLKEYFSFSMMLSCGIPCVILDGTDDDWKKLNTSYKYFKSIFGKTELKDWFRHFDKIMELFMMMRSGKITDHIKEMWKRVISYIPQGSGGDKILGGWVRLFVPYNNNNRLIGGLDKDIPCMNLRKSEPISSNMDYYDFQDKMKEFYLGADWGEMFSSFITTPAKLIDEIGNTHDVEFYSGFFPPHLTENDELSMNIGYILREDQLMKKKKLCDYYIEQGVNKIAFGVSIPKRLHKKTREILDIFNVCSYNYYGVDPEEEAKKEYYIKEGVNKVKNVYKYVLNIPNKFKNDCDIIEEIKELFNSDNVEYY
jgi:hypothetical protein